MTAAGYGTRPGTSGDTYVVDPEGRDIALIRRDRRYAMGWVGVWITGKPAAEAVRFETVYAAVVDQHAEQMARRTPPISVRFNTRGELEVGA